MDLSRVAMVIGKDKLPVLGQARIAVVGLGGVGSYVAESLCRSGVGHLLLIDADKVAASNINRQLPALTSTFGRFKTEVVRQRLLDINPDCEIETVSKFYEPGAFAEFFSGSFTFIADAIDSTPSKVDLLLECVQRDIPVISSMGTAGSDVSYSGGHQRYFCLPAGKVGKETAACGRCQKRCNCSLFQRTGTAC